MTSRMDIIGQNGNDAEIYHHLHKHGHRPKSGASPTYKTWISMKSRCFDPASDSYKWYGGRGITVCERWLEFVNFLADMGDRPKGHTLDRINTDGDYEPENCRWASAAEQARNKETSVKTLFRGEERNLVDIAREFDLPTTTIYRRFKQGYRGEDLISKENFNCFRKGESQRSSKLKEEDVRSIRRRLCEGESQVSIARHFGVAQPAISDIARGRTWTHVK